MVHAIYGAMKAITASLTGAVSAIAESARGTISTIRGTAKSPAPPLVESAGSIKISSEKAVTDTKTATGRPVNGAIDAIKGLPSRLRAMFQKLKKPSNTTKAISRFTLEIVCRLKKFSKYLADTVPKLLEKAKNLDKSKITFWVASLVVLMIIICIPVMVSGPCLGALGLGSAGPVAGSLAAGYQSAFGATASFSLLQSAAMLGYGAPVVAGLVQALAAVGAAWSLVKLYGACKITLQAAA